MKYGTQSEPSLPSFVRGQCCFAGKVSKSRYTSSIFVSTQQKRRGEREWNEFHAKVSRVVCVTVEIASGARTRETLPIINPHFKWRLIKSELEEKLVGEGDLAEDELEHL